MFWKIKTFFRWLGWVLGGKPALTIYVHRCGLCGKWWEEEYVMPTYKSADPWWDKWGVCPECRGDDEIDVPQSIEEHESEELCGAIHSWD